MDHHVTIGQQGSMSRTITEADIVLFAGVTGDFNPVHIDAVTASKSRFGGRVAHGMIAAGMISAVIGMRAPGPGTVYLKQTLNFRKPVYIGDTITATVEVVALREDKPIATLSTLVVNQNGETCVDGDALVLLDYLD